MPRELAKPPIHDAEGCAYILKRGGPKRGRGFRYQMRVGIAEDFGIAVHDIILVSNAPVSQPTVHGAEVLVFPTAFNRHAVETADKRGTDKVLSIQYPISYCLEMQVVASPSIQFLKVN